MSAKLEAAIRKAAWTVTVTAAGTAFASPFLFALIGFLFFRP